MTYIDRLNAFNLWLEQSILASSSQLLYFRLLDVFNRTGWPEWVQVDNLRLMSMIRTKSQHTVISARDELVRTGWIEYRKGKKGIPGQYRLGNGGAALPAASVSLEPLPEGQNSVQRIQCKKYSESNAPHSAPFPAPYSATFSAPFPATIYKTKTKNNSDSDSNARVRDPLAVSMEEAERYRDNLAAIEDRARQIGLPFAPGDVAMIDRLMGEYGADWVLKAIERTQNRNRTWGIVKGILRSWQKKGGIDDGTIGRSDEAVHGAGKDSASAPCRSLPGATRV